MDNGHADPLVEFLRRVSAKPPAFYEKCRKRLEDQDIFAKEDLAEVDLELISSQLQAVGATAGEIGFLKSAVTLAKAEEAPPVLMQQNATLQVQPAPQANRTTMGMDVDEGTHLAVQAGSVVVPLVIPGNEDPAGLLRRGGLTLQWKSRGQTKKVTKYRERKVPRVVDSDLALPTFYLQFLDNEFLPQEGDKFDLSLRAGNDNSEIQIVLPERFLEDSFTVGCGVEDSLTKVILFLKGQAEVQVSTVSARPGGFSPKTNYDASVSPSRLYFGLRTARPKANISLDKDAFGIPGLADIYLFAENHTSVSHMGHGVQDAFETCIGELPEQGGDFKKLSVFLKMFYEGGFAYNQKINQEKGYIPKNVGLAALGTVPAFEGQSGIATGYPHIVEPRCLRFSDTVPVTIRAVSEMSARHGRYGLCFTRCVHVWEDANFERDGVLNFHSIMPHGGFFYVPSTLSEFGRLGGLLYAFGESKESFEKPEISEGGHAAAAAAATTSSAPRPSVASSSSQVDDQRICVVCLDSDAVMATVPCGHRAYCATCAEMSECKRRPCPVCRKAVRNLMRVY